MKLKKAMKKIVALSAGVSMLGATLMGASAATLADYPSPFVKDGNANSVIVVGEKAATSDVVGAIDIAASLQAAAVSSEAVSVSSDGVSVTGGEEKDVNLGDSVSSGAIKDNDVPALLDTQIDFNGDSMDIHEEIYINANKLKVDHSLSGSADDELGADPYLITTSLGAVEYRYVFDDNLNASLVGHDDGDTLEIIFLGKSVEFESVSATQLKVVSSNEYYAEIDDVIKSDGHSITVVNIGDGTAVIRVDGQTKTIESTETATFDDAGNYMVKVSNVFYVDEKEDRSLTLELGDDITDTVNAGSTGGDSMELFGYSDTEAESEWLWTVKLDNGNIDYIGAIHNFQMDHKSAPDDDERPAVAVGEKIMFPNDYAYIEAASLKTETFEKLTVQPATKSLGGETYEVIEFTHTGDDELFSVNNTDTDTVYAQWNETTKNADFWILDSDGTKSKALAGGAGKNFTFIMDQDELMISYDNSTGNWTMDMAGVETWKFEVFNTTGSDFNDYFGGTTSDADDELWYDNTVISSIDEKVLSKYGIKSADDPEGMMDDDKFEFYVPEERQQVKVIIGSSETAVEGESGSVTSDKVNPIGVGLGVLDKDVSVGSQNMIVVGGPCVNTVAAELMGNPANCAEGFESGKAMIKLFENSGKTSMLVAGYGADDTSRATSVLVKYDMYALSGSEKTVITASASDIKLE